MLKQLTRRYILTKGGLFSQNAKFSIRTRSFDKTDISVDTFNLWKKYALLKCDIRDELDIEDGAEDAFRSATEAIFPQDLPSFKLVNNSLIDYEADNTAHMDSIFDSKLTSYYLNKRVEYRNKNHDIIYSLFDVCNPKIITRSLLFGVSRTDRNSNYVNYSDIHGTHVFYQTNNDEKVGLALKTAFEKGMLTVRYTVEVDCTEIHCVRDATYNEIIEGSEDVQTNKHTIVLENFIPYTIQPSSDLGVIIITENTANNKDDSSMSECIKFVDDGTGVEFVRQKGHESDVWKIVDIDNHLNGNQFWVNNKGNKNSDDCNSDDT